MSHGIVRTDKMSGTDVGKDLVSCRYLPSSVPTAVDNGNFLLIGNLVTGEREIFAASTPAANSNLDSVVLAASSEDMNNKKNYGLDEFQNPANGNIRGYRLVKGDIFSLSPDCVDVADGITLTPGTTILELQAGTKGSVVNSLTSGSTKVADYIATEVSNGVTYYVFRV